MANIAPNPAASETLKEGVSELKSKFKSDLSHWSRMRRFVTLRRIVPCVDCDATGKAACASCGGSGQTKLVWNEEASPCSVCAGTGQVTCVTCAGAGRLPNTHRKKILIILGVGGACWLLFFILVWSFSHDVAPAFLKQGNIHVSPGANRQPAGPPAGAQPAGVQPAGPGQPGPGYGQPPAGGAPYGGQPSGSQPYGAPPPAGAYGAPPAGGR